MFLVKALHLLAVCLLALFALSANARAMDDLQAQNTLLEKIELLPLDGPRAWLAQAIDSPEENTCVYGAFVSGPTHYNYFRSYQPTQGRYTQSDPIGLAGGLNRFSYANGAPTMYTDPLGLYTEVVVWQGAGIGSSSFGHVSTNVNGQNFSWGPGGWDKQSATAAEYNKRQQDFRGGTGVMLNLSPQQEAALASCMRASTAAYSAISNNCGNPVQQCLSAVGAGVGNSVLPSSILENLRSSPNSNGSVTYPSPRPGSSFGGGLQWR